MSAVDLTRAADHAAAAAEDRAAFERLVKMIERELELAGHGLTAQVQAAVRETGEYMLTLPSPAPAAAEQLLARARALRSRVTIEVKRTQASIGHSRASVKRARRMTQTYVPRPSSRYTTSA